MLKKVTLTFAQSLDGRIATSSGESRYISEEGSLKLNQELRRDHDAIIVGIGTVIADDPLLSCRIQPEKNPTRVILDPSLKLPSSGKIAETSEKIKTLIFYNEQIELNDNSASIGNKIEILKSRNIILKGVSAGAEGYLNLEAVLDELEHQGINSLMVEGGSAVLTSFLRSGLWTDMIVISAAKIIGKGIPTFGDLGILKLSDAVKPDVKNISIIGNEVCWHLTQPKVQQPVSTKIVYFTAPGEVEVREEKLHGPLLNQSLYSSRIMAISPGTEKQFYEGHFNRGKKADPSIDCIEGDFTYPFAYGYINVVENCSGERFFGFLNHSENFYLFHENLYPLEDCLEDDSALFIPHMETAVSIIHDTKPKLGDRVLITGAGVIGTLTQRILTGIMGIDCTVFDINSAKKTWFQGNSFCSEKKTLHAEAPFDICIEASGSADGLQSCIESSRRDGSITVASWYGEQRIPLNLGADFHWKRLKLNSSQVSNMSPAIGQGWNKKRRLSLATELLTKIETKDLLTHRFPIIDASEAYKLLKSDKALYGLIALEPGG